MRLDERGFTIVELLVVLAVFGVIAALAIPGILRARQSANESSAIGSMRSINSGQFAFAASCGNGFYSPTLTNLGTPPAAGGNAFIGPDLSTGTSVVKSGYTVTMGSTTGSAATAPATCNGLAAGVSVSGYNATATPQAGAGSRAFGTNAAGAVYEADQVTTLAMTDTSAPAGARVVQ
jgi:prepilin-type N-terminal cleavage/methylation domain-containing protein